MLCAFVYAPCIRLFYFIGSLRVSASYLFFLAYFVLIFLNFNFLSFLSFLPSMELCKCYSDLFLSSRPRARLATAYLIGMVEARSVNVKNTHKLVHGDT